MAFRREGLLVGQHARHHAADRIRDRHGRDLAAREHEIAHGDLFVDAFVEKALVHALIMAADQNKMLLREQLTRFFLIERRALRGEKHRVNMFAAAQRLMAQVKAAPRA